MKCIGPTLTAEQIISYKDKYGFHPTLEEMAEFYNLFASPIRLKIIHILRKQDHICVCDLKDIFEITASAMSQHLAKLKAYRIVQSVKQGQTVYYNLTDHDFLSLIPDVNEEL